MVKRISILPLVVLGALVAIFFYCARDYNPFSDLTNARVHILSWSLSEKDSVPVYSTGTLKVVVALAEEVDSFTIIAPGNRFWQDTTLYPDPSVTPASGGPCLFPISFYDTGNRMVTVRTFRSNGEMVPQEIPVRVVNPLKQVRVDRLYGTSFPLVTTGVQDKDVQYHWSFGPGRKVSSLTPSATALFTTGLVQGRGALWVSDLSDRHPSPADSFDYSFGDTSKPVIYYFNDNRNNDTFFVADPFFVFRVHIIDNVNQSVDTCSVNGGPFELHDLRSNVYTRIFRDITTHTRQNGPLEISVYAMDNQQFRNVTRRTFWTCFDTAGERNPDAMVRFNLPDKDSSVFRTAAITVAGDAENYRTDIMLLRISVNGTTLEPYKPVSGKSGRWDWKIVLPPGRNSVIVTAYSVENPFLAADTAIIVYDPNFTDTIKPMVWAITTADDLPADNLITAGESETLKIIAFDDGSYVNNVYINNLPVQSDDDRYFWTGSTGPLVHGIDGNRITIRAVDLMGNEREDSIVIYKNSKPALSPAGNFPAYFCIDSLHTGRFFWYDYDSDPVILSSPYKPAGMQITATGSYSWKPSSAVSEYDSIVIALLDGYAQSTDTTLYFGVRECGRESTPVRFTTTERDFPALLQAGVDTLSVMLMTDTQPGYALRYSARSTDRDQSIAVNSLSPQLIWIPAESDTGYRRLMVTVGDGSRGFDTLYPAVSVVHRNEYPCSLSWTYTGILTQGGELDLTRTQMVDTLFFTIHDRDDPLTETYTVTISRHNVRSVEAIKRRDFLVVIQPDSTRILDTLIVTIGDLTGSTDSAVFMLRFAPEGTNTIPALLGQPAVPSWACIDSVYRFNIVTYDPDNDLVDVLAVHAPSGMTVSKRGVVEWLPATAVTDSLVIRLFDQKEYSAAYVWPVTAVDCSLLPPGVRFLTSKNEFPAVLQAGKDSIDLQLLTVPASGALPFRYEARVLTGGVILPEVDTTGRLRWNPAITDTGTRVMLVTVSDRYERADTLLPSIKVVPANRYPCSLSYTYSGVTFSPGIVEIDNPAMAETLSFSIHDLDHPLTERYAVDIVKDRTRSAQVLAGDTRAFSLTLGSSALPKTDTIQVTVRDLTGSSDSVRIIVRYTAFSFEAIPNLSTLLTPAGGVTTINGNAVTRWEDTSSLRTSVFLSIDQYRRPELIANTVNGKSALSFVRNMSNDNLANLGIGTWANAPFTLFVVFKTDLIDNGRQTLVSSGGDGSVDFGITCNGTLGIFNETWGNTCSGATAGSNLAVQANRWYVATFTSADGVVWNGIQVQVALNTLAASSTLSITGTWPGESMLLGSGDYNDFTGGFNGMIATLAYYRRALTVTERQQVVEYLMRNYGITAN